MIRYPHIPTQTVIQPAQARFVRENITNPRTQNRLHHGRRRRGSGRAFVNSGARSLSHRGRPHIGDRTSMTPSSPECALSICATISGRTSPRLNEYVRTGGTLIVQYNIAGRRRHVGPFPITIGRGRVSVEEAPVQILKPKSPVLRFPNPITAADFEAGFRSGGSTSRRNGTNIMKRRLSPATRAKILLPAAFSLRATAKAHTSIRHTPGFGSCPRVYRARTASLRTC